MADELIDILKDDLSVLKTCLKSEAHKNGWLHASVHIWFYTKKGELLLQKRSVDKIAFPNLWDVSVAGHISAGESPILSAIREIEEEIGLFVTEKDLIKIGTFKELHKHSNHFIDHEIHHIYIGRLYDDISSLKIQEEELSAIQLIPIDVFKSKLLQPNKDFTIVPHSTEYYHFILEKINQHISNL